MLKDHTRGLARYKWLESVQEILNKTGFTYVWLQQNIDPKGIIKIKQTITDQGIQNIESKCENSSKGQSYKNIKSGWGTEHYLSILDAKSTKTLIKFRTANHKLPVETGRYRELPLIERKCPFCTNLVGDEYHYALECSKFKDIRNKYIDKKYHARPSMYNFITLMQSKNKNELKNLSIFLSIVMGKFK